MDFLCVLCEEFLSVLRVLGFRFYVESSSRDFEVATKYGVNRLGVRDVLLLKEILAARSILCVRKS